MDCMLSTLCVQYYCTIKLNSVLGKGSGVCTQHNAEYDTLFPSSYNTLGSTVYREIFMGSNFH